MAHGPYLCYRKVLSSSIVEAATFFESVNATGERCEHLLVAAHDNFAIYEVIAHDSSDNTSSSHPILSLVFREGVYGKVGSIQVIKRCVPTSSSTRFRSTVFRLLNDLIIISFDNAKFVTVEYNMNTNSLDYMNPRNVEVNGFVGSSSDIASNPLQYRHKSKDIGIGSTPILTISPEEDIACALIYGQYLYFFNTAANIHDSSYYSDTEHFISDIQQSLQLYGPILDVCFLSGYSKPAVAVLIESGSVPFGHVAKVRYACTLAVLAVDYQHKTVALLWKKAQMPHDSFKVFPLPSTQASSSVGASLGVLVISMNGILKVTAAEVTSMAFNSFGLATIHPSHRIQSSALPIGYELDSSAWMVLKPSIFIGTLKDATIVEVELLDGRSSTSTSNGHAGAHASFKATVLGVSVSSSAICSSSSGDYWFIGSRSNDSMLLRAKKIEIYSPSTNGLVVKRDFMHEFANSFLLGNLQTNAVTTTPTATPAAKRQRRSAKNTPAAKEAISSSQQQLDVMASPVNMQQMLSEIEAEELQLYGESLSKTTESVNQRSYHFELELIESITTLPSILSGSYVRTDNVLNQISDLRSNRNEETAVASTASQSYSPAAYIMESDIKDSFLVSAGVTDAAALYKISNGFRLNKISSGNYGEVTSIETINDPSLGYSLLILSYTTMSRIFRLSENNKPSTSEDAILESYELTAEKSAMLVGSSTIASGLLYSRTIAQVFSTGIRLIRVAKDLSSEDNEALQDMLLQESEELGGLAADNDDKIIEACVDRGYILLITQYSRFCVVEYSAKEDMLLLKYSKSIAADPSIAPGGAWSIFPVSISIFHGQFRLSTDNHQQKAHADSKSTSTTPIDAEEAFLYGASLRSSDDANEAMEEMKAPEPIASASYSSMAVLLDSEGVVWLLSLDHDLEVVGRLSACAEKPDVLHVIIGNDQETVVEDISNRLITVALVDMSQACSSSSRVQPNLALVGVTALGDLLVYQATYERGGVTSFRKIHHQHQLINRSAILRKKSSSASLFACRMSKMLHLNDYVGLVVYGSNPAFIATKSSAATSSSSSVISVFPLGFPELPYLQHGLISAVGFRSSSAPIEGLVTLWTEKITSHEQKMEASYHKSSQQQQQAIIGFYGSIPSLLIPQSNPNDAITMTKIATNGLTVHRFVELARTRAEDRIEQQILERSTMIMSCSQDQRVAFRDQVLTEADIANAQADFAYYFSDVTSWFQPNDPNSIASIADGDAASSSLLVSAAPPPAPPLIDREHRVVLSQDGMIVDEYFLGETERILDIEVAYASINHPVIVQDRRRGPAPPQQKSDKKVLILVGTSIADRHGEDSPADGRLLLFDLDYTKLANNQLQAKLKLSSIAVGPSSIIRQFSNNRIFTTMGPAIAIYRLDYEADASNPSAAPTSASTILLEQISFYYAKFYIASVTIVKNFIFIADAANRIELLVWRDEDCNLTLISKEYSKATMTRAIAMINDGQSLATIIGDDQANIQVLQFDPR
jgi:hypothetical protein